MRVVAVLPARYASTRLPGKPLLAETGKPLIQHVWEQVRRARRVEHVLVATDDPRIAEAVARFGGQAVMTRPDHPSGTDRIAEVAVGLMDKADLIVNVQGDEPEIEPECIDQLIDLHAAAGCDVATLACPFPPGCLEGPGSPADPNAVKVVLAPADWWQAGQSEPAGLAVYFSRSLIPYPRDTDGTVACAESFLLHLGIYAYTPRMVLEYAGWPVGQLERVEKLEQLRLLERGRRIAVGIVPRAAPGIDTPADYAAFAARVRARTL